MQTLVAAAIFIAGLGCSGFCPLGMSLLGKYFKRGIAVRQARLLFLSSWR